MGGLGKTALAKACYDRTVSSKKEIKHHFIRNINESCESQVGVEGIVQDLYSKLLSEKNLSREDLDMKCRRARLSRSKVFIVLDNVETPCQLEQLLLGDVSKHNKLFAMGSRIIVTTRNKKVLQNAMARVYAMKALSYNESIRLFSLHAFRQYYPPDDWMHLSHLAASYCKGNSLALRVLGGTLFGEDIQYWQNFLSGLRRIQKPEIHDILRRSYNKLGVQERRLFLDVACLLNGIARSRLIKYMAVTCSSTYCIVKDLIDKSLLICISCKDGEKIEVHDLLKEMAWNIVNEEQKLRKRTRLVDPEDIHKLLTTHKVKNWATFISNVKHCPDMNSGELMELDLNETPVIEPPEAIYHVKQGGILRLCGKHFANFPAISARLQEFHLCHSAIKDINPYGHHQASSELLPEFGWLELVGNLQCKSLPKNIWNMVSSLLTIRHSPLLENLPEISEPPSSIQELDQLNSIDLSYCKSLEHIPSNIQKLPKLYGLYLRGCRSISSLPELPSNLSILDVGGCKSLQALPSNASKLSWESLRFYNCPELDRTFPDEIVANYPVYATLPRRCKVRKHQLVVVLSDIPEWFSSKSANGNDGSSVMVHLPPSNGSSERPMLKGIAFGVVWFSDSFCVWPTMKCDCSIGTITVASWSSCHFSLDGDGTNSSDKVFLWFDQNLSGKSKEREGKGEEEAWYVKYAGLAVSFRFYPRLGYNFKIKRCGVSLMY
ncbi:unnamed protein product [Linum tenue]|uniref:NB-ARC domain-containing protein n=1 Tax=Linum tenue TaxID=586396 RepID=A0AAV0RG43_9ROSI|nr:unnamed protein product [Linum tenue]